MSWQGLVGTPSQPEPEELPEFFFKGSSIKRIYDEYKFLQTKGGFTDQTISFSAVQVRKSTKILQFHTFKMIGEIM